ncbi:organic cation transporter protein-like isoform X2 [Portunus trituberculatus]|uniref:organic cation transporter protein-like isoform X2 n=1 Tax=Portunus trituberculatus TaxID=210409 RepID=UPI001E1CD392|nr:organic cation transporter protein-like isoform X2 [Portunus trituberculatus]
MTLRPELNKCLLVELVSGISILKEFLTATMDEKLTLKVKQKTSHSTTADNYSINSSTKNVCTATTDRTNSNGTTKPLISPAKTAKLGNAQDFDDILEVVGSFGRYQKKMMFLIFMPVSFFAAFTSNLFLFQMVMPDYWCHTPGREKTSLSLAQWHQLTRPSNNGEPSRCLMHEINWTYKNTSLFTVTNQTKECSNGWEFDTTEYSATVGTSLGWVCEHDHYSHYTLSISMAGNAFGTLILPILADKYVGRRFMFFITLILHIIFTIPLLWVTGAQMHMALRFLQGLCFETNYLMPYIIYMEVIPPERRALAVMVSFIAWTFGMCSTAFVAWLVPHWKYLAVISIIPSLLGFLYWRHLSDSPRWLLAKGKMHQCVDVLLQISVTNRKQVSQHEVEVKLMELIRQQPVDRPLSDVLRYPKLALRTLMLFLMSFMQFVVYSVTMLSMTVLPNSFLAHFVLSIFELPSNFFGWAITHYLGRRFMAYCTFLLLSVFCLAAYFSIQNEWLLLTILGFVKFFSTCGLFVVFLMASEALPTPVRTSGTGITVVFGMLGMVTAPHVLHSGFAEGGHYWILLAMTVASAICMIPFPETLGLQLPQTFQDAEDLGQGRPFIKWIHHWNLHNFMQPPESQHKTVNESLMS